MPLLVTGSKSKEKLPSLSRRPLRASVSACVVVCQRPGLNMLRCYKATVDCLLRIFPALLSSRGFLKGLRGVSGGGDCEDS